MAAARGPMKKKKMLMAMQMGCCSCGGRMGSEWWKGWWWARLAVGTTERVRKIERQREGGRNREEADFFVLLWTRFSLPLGHEIHLYL